MHTGVNEKTEKWVLSDLRKPIYYRLVKKISNFIHTLSVNFMCNFLTMIFISLYFR